MPFIFIVLALTLLYFSGRFLLWHLTHLVHHNGGGRRFLIILWSLVFLPGTIIHELSHFFTAILVGARTGKIEIFPEFLDDDEDGGVALGSVQTQKLNMVQGVLVGLAPFFVGLALLVWLGFVLQQSYVDQNYTALLFQGYLFFTISNSFFPSKSDLTHVIPATIISTILVLVLWFIGFQFSFSPSQEVLTMFQTIFVTLLASAVLNFIFGSILYLIKKISP